MAFIPILSDQSVDYILNNSYYRNAAREAQWGSPVFFAPSYRPFDVNGEPGPKYSYGYNYYNSPETIHGNCTW